MTSQRIYNNYSFGLLQMLQLSRATVAYKLLMLQFITFDIAASINTVASHAARCGTMVNGVVKSVRAINRGNLYCKQLDVDSRGALSSRRCFVQNFARREPSAKGSNEEGVRNKLQDRMNISSLTLMLKFPNVHSFSAGPSSPSRSSLSFLRARL